MAGGRLRRQQAGRDGALDDLTQAMSVARRVERLRAVVEMRLAPILLAASESRCRCADASVLQAASPRGIALCPAVEARVRVCADCLGDVVEMLRHLDSDAPPPLRAVVS